MKTVLLIDEDQAFRATLAEWLARERWQVIEAANGDLGLGFIQLHQPAIVICDLLMPRCNGFRLCRIIRKLPEAEQPKIIISSGRGYPGDRLTALEAGADEYLVKPVVEGQLLKLLEQLTAVGYQRAPVQSRIPVSAASGATVVHPGGERPKLEAEGPPTRIKFWGVRGSIPTPGPTTVHYGGNTTCVEVRADGEIIILDAGSGLRLLGQSLVAEFKDQPIQVTMLITHTHWDHIHGFPFFLPAYNPRNRIHIVGFEGSREGLQTVLASQMESPYFPISMRQMEGHITIQELTDMKFCVGRVEIEAVFANHPGICVGYRINTSKGSIVFLPDNEPYQRLRGQGTGEVTAASLAYARAQDEKLIEFIRDADVLIIDSQYDDAEYQEHVGWGHGCLDDVVTLALIAGVKQLFLFHHDPNHSDEQITHMVNWARDLVTMHGDSLPIEGAREGVEVVLNPVVEPANQTA